MAPLNICYQIIRFNIVSFCSIANSSQLWLCSNSNMKQIFYGSISLCILWKKMDVVVNFDLTTCHKMRTLQIFSNILELTMYIFVRCFPESMKIGELNDDVTNYINVKHSCQEFSQSQIERLGDYFSVGPIREATRAVNHWNWSCQPETQ